MKVSPLIKLMIILFAMDTFALESIQKAFVKNYPEAKGKALDNCSTCHMPNISKGMNRYALDLKRVGMKFSKIELLDSDRDGVVNIKEIHKNLFPGSRNSQGGGIFIFHNPKGDVHFNHQAHISNKAYVAEFKCTKCHSKNGFKKEFRGTKDFSQVAHNLCLDCHTHKAPSSTKAAIKCIDCHSSK